MLFGAHFTQPFQHALVSLKQRVNFSFTLYLTKKKRMSCTPYTGASSRKSYDTDSITLRTMFAYDISNNAPFSTGYILTSLTKGVVSFVSPLVSLSSIGYTAIPAQISTLSGELLSTAIVVGAIYLSSPAVFLPSTVNGLASAGYISTSGLVSTVIGLGSAGYLSSAVFDAPLNSTVIGLASSDYISTSQLTSTVTGLGSSGYLSSFDLFISSISSLSQIGYVSTSQLTSTVGGLSQAGYISSTQLTSSLQGLASIGYISTSQLTSTVGGLATAGYISTSQLQSTIDGLGSSGYLSTITPIFRSTFSNTQVFATNYCNIAYLYSNLTVNQSVNTISFDMGQLLRNEILVSTSKLDIELKTNLQFVYYDPTSRDYQFNNYLVRGSNFTTSNIIGQESLTYYILNANPINLPYFFLPSSRFLVTDNQVISTLKNDNRFSTISLTHYWAPRIPATNQFFVSPMSTACVSVVLDNTPS